MKITFQKVNNSTLVLAREEDERYMSHISNGSLCEFDVRVKDGNRNYVYHKRIFAMVKHVYDKFIDLSYAQTDETTLFNQFRDHLTILAGHSIPSFCFRTGEWVQIAKSWSFHSMKQNEFEAFSVNMQNAIMGAYYQGATDKEIDELWSYF